jgi:hypothetical protein
MRGGAARRARSGGLRVHPCPPPSLGRLPVARRPNARHTPGARQPARPPARPPASPSVSRALPPVGVHRTVEQLPQRTTVWECENTVVLRAGGLRGVRRSVHAPRGGGRPRHSGRRRERAIGAARRPPPPGPPGAPARPAAAAGAHMLKHPWHLTSCWGGKGPGAGLSAQSGPSTATPRGLGAAPPARGAAARPPG